MSCLHVLGFTILNRGTCHFKKSHRRKRAEAVTRSPMPLSWSDTLQCSICDMTCSKKSLSSQPALCCRAQQCWRFRSFFKWLHLLFSRMLVKQHWILLDTLSCTHTCCYIHVYINEGQRRYVYVHTSTMSLDNGKRPPLNWYHDKFDIYASTNVCNTNVCIYILQAISSTAVCTILPEKTHLQVVSLRKSLKAPGSCSLWRSCCRSRHYYSAMTLLQRHWHFPAPGWTKLYSFGQPLRATPHAAVKTL